MKYFLICIILACNAVSLFSQDTEIVEDSPIIAPPPKESPNKKVFYPSGPPEQASEDHSNQSISFSGFAQVLIFLIVVGTAAVVIVRKTKGNFNMKGIESLEGIKILDTKSLGGKQFLVVASYEGQKVMIGVSPQGIQPVHAFPPQAPKEFSID